MAVVAAEMGVPLLPVGDLGLGTRAPENERHFIDALHFTSAGHELMARMLVQSLRERHLFEPDERPPRS